MLKFISVNYLRIPLFSITFFLADKRKQLIISLLRFGEVTKAVLSGFSARHALLVVRTCLCKNAI